MKKLIIFSLLIFFLILLIVNIAYSQTPSTIDTAIRFTTTTYAQQRKFFYANGLFWVFYADDSFNLSYKTSADGATWSSKTSIVYNVWEGYQFSIFYDGTYMHYAWSTGSGIYYRRGIPKSDGTIEWSAPQQLATTDGGNYPNVAVDSAGYPWIAYENNSRPYVAKSSTNDGTWTTESGFPYKLTNEAPNFYWGAVVIPLTSQKVYVIYTYNHVTVKGKLWTGSWGNEEIVTTNWSEWGDDISAVAEGDDVHLIFTDDKPPYEIRYVKRTYGIGWSGETVVTEVVRETPAVLSIDTSTNNLYCFWANKTNTIVGQQGNNHIYYKKYISGVWDANPTDWINESTDTLNSWYVSSYYKDYDSRIGLIYVTDTYKLRHAYLTLSGVTTTTTSTTTTSTISTTTIPSDTELPKWGPTFNHTPIYPTIGQDVTISVDWSDNTDLSTVIIYENSSGSYQSHVCNLVSHQCSGEETLGMTILSSVILVFSGSLTFIAITPTRLKKLNKTMLYFVSIIVVIILISILMFPKIPQTISKLLRLGIVSMEVGPTTFTHIIPSSQLQTSGMIVEYYSFANDSAGNGNTTQINTFTVQAATTTTTTSTTTTTIPIVPKNTETRLYLNETEGNFYYLNNTYANFTVWVNVSGTVYLDTNTTGWTARFGDSPLTRIVLLNSTQNNTYYNITGYFSGNATHNLSYQTHYAIVYVTETTTTTIESTTTVEEGNGGNGGAATTTTIGNTTTTAVVTTTTTLEATTTETTITTTEETTTITEEKPKGIKTWYVIPIVIVFITVAIVVWYFKYMKKPSKPTDNVKTFEELKEKWNR